MSNDENKNFFAVFGLLFGASVWGIIWFPYRLLEQAGFTGIFSSFITYAIAAAFASIVFAKHWRGIFAQPKNIIWLVLAAGWTNLSYVLAVIDGQVMRVMLLFYLAPVWTLILAHFWLKERTGLKGLIVICVSLIGAFIMLYDPNHPNSLPLPQSQSDWLGLSSGIGFAATNVITRKSVHLSLQAKSFAVWIGVVFMSLLAMLVVDGKFSLPTVTNIESWMIVLLVAALLFSSTLLVQYGVTHVAAVRASIIFLFELVVAALAAYFLAGEVMTINEWIGGLMIISAAMYAAIGKLN